MGKPLRLLLVEDSPDDELLVLRELRRSGFDVTHLRVQTAETMRHALAVAEWDVVISDFSMPNFSALGALSVLQQSGHDLPFIITSGTLTEEAAVEALRAGAHDFMAKSKLARLAPAIDREMADAANRRARHTADENVKRLEEQVRQAQKMEAIGRLAGGVAHDFNNILTAILATADLVLETPDLAAETRADIVNIKESGLRAAAITRQLLAFSRKQVVQPHPLDINTVVQSVAPMLRRLLPATVKLDVDARATGITHADPTQLEQVLLNLVVNAGDAMPEGGTVTIGTADITADAAAADGLRLAPGAHVVLSVKDTGIGMDEATAAQVFEPFFTTKELGRGTGLGLATVYGIVEQSGGQVIVRSRPGEGATFSVFLPCIQATPMTNGTAERPQSDLKGNEVVLVVEDDPAVRAPICRTLRQLGYFVIDATNGEHALAVLQEYHAPVHLVVSDVVMPEMNGAELVELLHSWYPSLKVLFVSGYSEQMIKAQGVLSEDADYLPKPFTAEELGARVRHLLDHGRPMRRRTPVPSGDSALRRADA